MEIKFSENVRPDFHFFSDAQRKITGWCYWNCILLCVESMVLGYRNYFFRIVKERLLAGVIESAFYYVSRASIWSTENIFFRLRAKIIGWCCRNCIIGVQMIYLMEIELLRKILEQLSFPSGLWSEEVAGGIKENAIFLMCPEQKIKQKEKFLRIPATSSDSSCKKSVLCVQTIFR